MCYFKRTMSSAQKSDRYKSHTEYLSRSFGAVWQFWDPLRPKCLRNILKYVFYWRIRQFFADFQCVDRGGLRNGKWVPTLNRRYACFLFRRRVTFGYCLQYFSHFSIVVKLSVRLAGHTLRTTASKARTRASGYSQSRSRTPTRRRTASRSVVIY